MNNENTKITLPKEIQKQMIEFFLKTSIPRLKQKKQRLLSENTKSSGSVYTSSNENVQVSHHSLRMTKIMNQVLAKESLKGSPYHAELM